jgi:hypothetical protein
LIPFATTTISVLELTVPDGDIDGFPDVAPTWAPIATGVRAVISSPGGTTLRDGSVQTILGYRLACDPTRLMHTHRVLDEQAQTLYECNWTMHRAGMAALDHEEAELRIVEGYAP